MSIINDALKKVQEHLKQKNTEPKAEKKTDTPPPSIMPSSPVPETIQPQPAPVKKTLASIEQEEIEKKLQSEAPVAKQSPHNILPIPVSPESIKIIALSAAAVIVAITILFFAFSFIKKHPFSKRTAKATTTKPEKIEIVSLSHEPQAITTSDKNSVQSSSVNSEELPNENKTASEITPAPTAEPNPKPVTSQESASPESFLPKIFNSSASNQTKQKSSRLILKGIMTQNNQQVALINDGIYELGEIVDGRKILSISSREVRVLDEDRVITLTLDGKSY